MGGIRRYQRSIAKYEAERNGLKANKQYTKKGDKSKRLGSGLKLAFKKLFGGK